VAAMLDGRLSAPPDVKLTAVNSLTLVRKPGDRIWRRPWIGYVCASAPFRHRPRCPQAAPHRSPLFWLLTAVNYTPPRYPKLKMQWGLFPGRVALGRNRAVTRHVRSAAPSDQGGTLTSVYARVRVTTLSDVSAPFAQTATILNKIQGRRIAQQGNARRRRV